MHELSKHNEVAHRSRNHKLREGAVRSENEKVQSN